MAFIQPASAQTTNGQWQARQAPYSEIWTGSRLSGRKILTSVIPTLVQFLTALRLINYKGGFGRPFPSLA